jgi:uridine phosphorylase
VVHLRPTAAIAADAILPGDPGRALALAQELLDSPLMSNHHRGLWGYHGETPGGRPLTVQSTGIGGPSAAVVLHELAGLGVRRAIRVGTCTAASARAPLGSLLVVDEAVARDGTSRGLGVGGPVRGSAALADAIAAAAPDALRARVATVDLYYGRPAGKGAEDGCDGIDLATAPLFALGPRLGVEVAAVLAVVADAAGDRLPDDALTEAELRMGRAAAAAFAASPG